MNIVDVLDVIYNIFWACRILILLWNNHNTILIHTLKEKTGIFHIYLNQSRKCMPRTGEGQLLLAFLLRVLNAFDANNKLC